MGGEGQYKLIHSKLHFRNLNIMMKIEIPIKFSDGVLQEMRNINLFEIL